MNIIIIPDGSTFVSAGPYTFELTDFGAEGAIMVISLGDLLRCLGSPPPTKLSMSLQSASDVGKMKDVVRVAVFSGTEEPGLSWRGACYYRINSAPNSLCKARRPMRKNNKKQLRVRASFVTELCLFFFFFLPILSIILLFSILTFFRFSHLPSLCSSITILAFIFFRYYQETFSFGPQEYRHTPVSYLHVIKILLNF